MRGRAVGDRTVLNVCFHGIGAPRRELEDGEAPYWVTTDSYLRILDELATWPEVRLSFDDGNASDVDHGLEPLVERGLTATFFLVASRLGTPGSLAENDVRALLARGMRIGTHGMDHRSWRGMDDGARRRELVEAREHLARLSATTVDEAALPRGEYDRRVLASLRSLGYAAVHTSDRRPARRGAWLQPRFSVRSTDTPASLRAEVLAAPSWPRRLERSIKGAVKRLR